MKLQKSEFSQSFDSDQRGASMVEYALLAALIAVGAISSVSQMGFKMRDTFTEVAASAGIHGIEGEDDEIVIP